MKSKSLNIKKLVGIATFAALAYATTFVFHFKVQFLTFDAKDAIITIASFIYGPISALIMALIPALIEFVTISDTGFWGFLMNFASSAAFAFTASMIYKLNRSFNGAIFGIFFAVVFTTGIMLSLNILITPIYMKVPTAIVIDLLPKLLFPFNLAKSMMNAAITMLLYKPVSTALKRAKLVEGKMDTRFNKQSVIMIILGLTMLAGGIVIFIILN